MLQSPYPMPEILPPAKHPRLMLRKRDLPRIRQNLEMNLNQTADLFRELCDYPIRGMGATPEYGSYHLKEYLALEAKALKSLLDQDVELAKENIRILRGLLSDFSLNEKGFAARHAGHLIFVAAQVYDWCYEWLKEEEKEEIIFRCEKLAEEHLEMGYPPVGQAAITGHGTETQLLRDLLALSIACYDERPDIYHFCAGRLFAEFYPAFETSYAAAFSTQGPCYGGYRLSCALWSGLLMYSMSGKKVLPDVVADEADSLLYLTRGDGEALRLGDDFNEKKASYVQKNPFPVPLFLAAVYGGKMRHYQECLKQLSPEYLVPVHHGKDYYKEGAYGEGLISPTVFLVWNGLQPPLEDPPLPAGRYFGWPVGCTVYNDGQRLVLMKIGILWGGNHDHFDTGSFQIYDGEILASDSGVYDSYGTAHRKQYTIQTVAHNCLLVDGKGTRVPREGREAQTVDCWLSDYGMAKVISHEESDSKYEITGDLTQAYKETCNRVIRSMCWEPEKSRLTVKDTVVPIDPEAAVTFLIHCQNEPVIAGNEIIIPGKNKSLRCRVKSPAQVSVKSIGGAGAQFVANGVHYEPIFHTEEEGWGRIEITARGETVSFCVEMEICGNENPEK